MALCSQVVNLIWLGVPAVWTALSLLFILYFKDVIQMLQEGRNTPTSAVTIII